MRPEVSVATAQFDGEVPFPVIDPSALTPRSRGRWELNRKRAIELRLSPGAMKRYTWHNQNLNVQLVSVRKWPDGSLVDHQAYVSMGRDATFYVPYDSIFTVISSLFDCLGNLWCMVLICGRLGYVDGFDLITC